MNILGISAFYHDSAACLVRDGVVVAAAQEERFSRRKHDAGFPIHAIRYCLAAGGVGPNDLEAVVFYDKPLEKFVRILQTYFGTAPRGLRQYLMAMPVWLREKLWIPAQIESALRAAGVRPPERIWFAEHHESHAASAFYPSPFASAAILTLDGVGEWATTSIAHGRDNRIQLLAEIRFPHSLGLLYSAFTAFTGFRVNSGEYKLMGLAPYGEPAYADVIRDRLIEIRDDGSFRLNLEYFGYLDGLSMTNDRFAALFGGPARQAESGITRREMDLARSIQDVTEEVVLKLARRARELTGERRLCLAGGVALNCVANARVLREGIFDEIWIQPAAGDAGGALGAALLAWHQILGQPRVVAVGDAAARDVRRADGDGMAGAYLGPSFEDGAIAAWLDARGYPYRRLADGDLEDETARAVCDQKVVGLLQGRMEFGPRALGNRSIIGDARSQSMQSVMNLKIKFRESFRPFAPAVLEERCGEYFAIDRPSPYMLLTAPVRADRCRPPRGDERGLPVVDWVNRPRSDLPAITHVDYSARLQTVSRATNPRFHAILTAFAARTGCGVMINTSFNVRGEPIVCTPADAYRCFMRTEMDTLVLGNLLLDKQAQPPWHEGQSWRRDLQLD